MSNYLSSPRSLELLSFTTNAISNGDGYSGGQLFQGVNAGNTKTVYIENTNAEEDIVVLTPNIASDGQVYTQATANPSEDTQGATATVQTVSTGGNGLGADVRTAGDNETGVLSGGDNYPQRTIGGGMVAQGRRWALAQARHRLLPSLNPATFGVCPQAISRATQATLALRLLLPRCPKNGYKPP